jgi:hypothetical protein
MPFNFTEYREECRKMSDGRLQQELEKYTRHTASAGVSYGVGLVLIPFTLGLSAIGSVAASASGANALAKADILKDESESRQVRLRVRARDILGGYAIGLTCGAVSHGLGGHALDSVVHHAAQHAHHAMSPAEQHVLKYGDKGADFACEKGSKGLERNAYGEATETRKQYGDGKNTQGRITKGRIDTDMSSQSIYGNVCKPLQNSYKRRKDILRRVNSQIDYDDYLLCI